MESGRSQLQGLHQAFVVAWLFFPRFSICFSTELRSAHERDSIGLDDGLRLDGARDQSLIEIYDMPIHPSRSLRNLPRLAGLQYTIPVGVVTLAARSEDLGSQRDK